MNSCIDLYRKIPDSLFAIASGTKSGSVYCYAGFLEKPASQMCEDSRDALSVLSPLMDRALENCLNDGAIDCKVGLTHEGLVSGRKVVASFPANGPIRPILRQTPSRTINISQNQLSALAGRWVNTYVEKLYIENKKKYIEGKQTDPDSDPVMSKWADACKDPNPIEMVISLKPQSGNVIGALDSAAPDFVSIYYGINRKAIIAWTSGGDITLADIVNGGSCIEDRELSEADFYRRYSGLDYSKYLLGTQIKKGQSDAQFNSEHHRHVTETVNWRLESTGILLILSDKGDKPDEYKKCP
jgi:hypothetical protein